MKWAKHGVVWRPDGRLPWARTHATCPTPHWRADGALRLFVQCRDDRGVGRIGWVDVDPGDPRRVLRGATKPVLDVGEPGCFDDNGVFPTSVVRLDDGRLYLYYVGFELCHHIRYRLLSGVAVSDDDGDTFRRLRPTPVLERSAQELHFRCAPFVVRADGAFRMWYVAGSRWETVGGKAMPVYDLRYLESADGLTWPGQGQPVLAMDPAREHGLGRPFVVATAQGFRMHYSIRQREPARYRLGMARSSDGQQWHRADADLALDADPGQWDALAMSYSCEVTLPGAGTWLLYNGNDFGVAGFGAARLLEC